MEKKIFTKKELAEFLKVSIAAINKFMGDGLEPETYRPLRFTFERYQEWDQKNNKKQYKGKNDGKK